MIIDDVPIRHIGHRTVFRRADGVFHVEIVKDPGKQGQRPRKVHVDVQQRFHRAVQPVHQRNRGRDGTHGEARIGAGDDEISARKVDQQRAQLGKEAHYHPEPPAALLFLQAQLRNLFVDRHETLVFPLFPGKELHQQRSGDGKRLVDQLVHLIVLRLAVGEQGIASFPNPLRRQNQQRNHHNSHQRQLPAHGKQRHKACNNRRDVGDNVREGAGDHGADPADVRVHAGDDVTLLFRGEEGVRHVLKMVVHLVFHVEDNPLGDPGIDIALENRDHLRGRERHKRQDQQPDQQRHVFPHQRLIHDPPRDDTRQQAEDGRHQDCHKHQHKLKPVRQQIGQNPPDQGAVHLGHVLFLFFGQEAPRSQPARRRCHRIAAFLFIVLFSIVFTRFFSIQLHSMLSV